MADMGRSTRFALTVVACVCALLASRLPLGAAESAAVEARAVLRTADFSGGLIVHLGCGDGRLTAALGRGENVSVHGLDRDPARIVAARRYLDSQGIYGRVSVDSLAGPRLPYAENLANLVVDDASDISLAEMMRVLVPGGVLCRRDGRSWSRIVKPRPDGMDEWTHYQHDASGNAVARDKLVGPPRRLQWRDGPNHVVSHEHTPSLAAMVSAGGRVFCLVDEGPVATVMQPAEWRLVARDAFNGIRLWQRDIPEWWPRIAPWTQGPRQLPHRLVAAGERVYVTLGYFEPVSALDASTGKTVRVYEETRGAEELIWHEGVLLAVVRQVSAARVNELEAWPVPGTGEKAALLQRRDTLTPLVKRLRGIDKKTPLTLVALDAATGRVLWRLSGAASRGLSSLSLCASGNRVFCRMAGLIRCFDLLTGKPLWSVPGSRVRSVDEQTVICVDKKTVTVLAAETGKTVWTQKLLLTGGVRDTFIIAGSLWLGGFKPYDTGRKYTGSAWGPYFVTQRDLATGVLVKQIEPENPGHHHRCYQNKATERYILGGRRGTEFIDLRSGEVLWHSWARGSCMYGVMPANGLLYVPPHTCACYATAKLIGFSALAPAASGGHFESAAGVRALAAPEPGPAAGSGPPALEPADPEGEWPSYRHDATRGGATTLSIAQAPLALWTRDLGGHLSAPVVAGGKVLLTEGEAHRVVALDADSGRPAWHFITGGRVDSPPTVYGANAIVGCRDGYVYNLRLADGVLVWRLRLAEEDRRIMIDGQVESVSPAMGSVLIRNGVVYVTVGRSSYLDDGIDLCRLDPRSGRLLSRTPIYSPDPDTGRQPAQYDANTMPGARADILSSDANCIYLRDMVFDDKGTVLRQGGAPHLFAVTGFLDDSWAHRSYLIFGRKHSMATGCSGYDRKLIRGRLLVFDETRIFGYGRRSVHWSNQYEDGPYEAFSVNRADGSRHWSEPLDVQGRAMLLAGDVLYVAGPVPGDADPNWYADAAGGATVLALAASDGTVLSRCELKSIPTFDGMAAAYGKLFLTTLDGSVVCLGRPSRP